MFEDIDTSRKKKSIHVDFDLTKLPLLLRRVTALMGILVRIILLKILNVSEWLWFLSVTNPFFFPLG